MTRRPAPALAAWIERYVGYAMTGFPAGVHRGRPSRHMTLIVSIGDPIDVVAQTDRAQAPARYRAVAGGLQVAPALIAHDGTQEGVAIELTPLGCRALLGMPAGELRNLSAELADVVGPTGAELWERLEGPAPWEARFATCDLVLGRLLREDPLHPSLRRAWGLLEASWGRCRSRSLRSDRATVSWRSAAGTAWRRPTSASASTAGGVGLFHREPERARELADRWLAPGGRLHAFFDPPARC